MTIDYLPRWTTNWVTSLAVNAGIAQAARQLVLMSDQWQVLASDGYSAWAVFNDEQANQLYHVKIDLFKVRISQRPNKRWECDCKTYKSPCKHTLALLYILVDEPHRITYTEAQDVPPWIDDWLNKHAKSARKRHRSRQRQMLSLQNDTPQKMADRQQRRIARQQTLANGIADLQQWLEDMLRRGLVGDHINQQQLWNQRAARLFDAQAPGLATWLQDIARIPKISEDWIQPMLEELGRMYLVCESFKHYETFSTETQADLRTIIGWHLKKHEVQHSYSSPIRDCWQVIGYFESNKSNNRRNPFKIQHKGLRNQRIWLYGQHSQRNALILEFTFGEQPYDTYLEIGTVLDADVLFYPSRSPLRAFIDKQYAQYPLQAFVGKTSVINALQDYSQAFAKNPWIRQYPFILENVTPLRLDDQWIIRDHTGTYLPTQQDKKMLDLYSFAGALPIQVMGEWDGSQLTVLSAMDNQHFLDFSPYAP